MAGGSGSGRPAPLSRRTAWDLSANALARRLEAARAEGRALLDLTASDPAACGLAWPPGLLAAALTGPGLERHAPDPRGAAPARAAVARYLAALGAPLPPEQVLITASTSEAYAFLLQLLCDPGDEVLAPAPGYPLHEVLCALQGVALRRYPLGYDGTWHLDLAALAAAVTPRTRAVVVVSPGNPTGAALEPAELAGLEALCAERGLALVGDEVFADTALAPPVSVAGARRCLAFQLGGLSKTCGLPQLKAAWLAAAGPAPEVARALARLEVIADAFLSVSGPAQQALPALLDDRERFLAPLRARLAENRRRLAAAAAAGAPFDLLRSGGGWSAVLRVGQTVDEEALCLRLLEAGVVVHPGYFYDFERPGHLVVSLLPPPDVVDAGIRRWAALPAP